MQIACLDVRWGGWASDRCRLTRYDNRDERIIESPIDVGFVLTSRLPGCFRRFPGSGRLTGPAEGTKSNRRSFAALLMNGNSSWLKSASQLRLRGRASQQVSGCSSQPSGDQASRGAANERAAMAVFHCAPRGATHFLRPIPGLRFVCPAPQQQRPVMGPRPGATFDLSLREAMQPVHFFAAERSFIPAKSRY